jgi:hypothetical protein
MRAVREVAIGGHGDKMTRLPNDTNSVQTEVGALAALQRQGQCVTSPRPDGPALQRVIARVHEELFWQERVEWPTTRRPLCAFRHIGTKAAPDTST